MAGEQTTQAAEGVDAAYVPWDKSWFMRMGALDLRHEQPDMADFLGSQAVLSDDLVALGEAVEAWPHDNEPVFVGESGTLYRTLLFLSWKFDLGKQFITTGTLADRDITQDPAIVELSQSELLRLDNHTSQWASAKVLSGDRERLDEHPYKLGLTYVAVGHWEEQHDQGLVWEPRIDDTIVRQAATYQKLLRGEAVSFTPEQAEDYCFAVALDFMPPAEEPEEWQSLKGHETNRLVEMPVAMGQADAGQTVDSRDHRVVQAIVMRGRLKKEEVAIAHPEAVNKSWPEFWSFMAETA